MITFVHLSDIHFSPRDDLSQFDLDQQIRRALLEDLSSKPANGSDYDALLITGDIAFGGKQDEYKRAQAWLDEVFTQTGIARASTYTVPGNHDIDRAYVEPDFPLWETHVRLRQSNDPVLWRDVIAKQLQRDPLHTMLAPLKAYNDFAQGYGCRTEPDKLAWNKPFPKLLDDGRVLNLHGLNSALVSDAADAPGKLLVSEFQTSHFKHASGIVDIVMCHHPPEWLMDKASLRESLRVFAPVALFGHEHSTRIAADTKQVQLFAGAVQPSRRDPDWLPTYHILQLSTATSQEASELVVTIHTREFNKQTYKFRARRNEEDLAFEEHRLSLPVYRAPVVALSGVSTSTLCSSVESSEAVADMAMPTPTENSHRELLVQFFRLGAPDRYASASEAGLLRDGDDLLQPQVMWAEVFRRAATEAGGLAKFWDAVARRVPDLKDVPNPFTS